jgi:hypothetical protein
MIVRVRVRVRFPIQLTKLNDLRSTQIRMPVDTHPKLLIVLKTWIRYIHLSLSCLCHVFVLSLSCLCLVFVVSLSCLYLVFVLSPNLPLHF